MNLRSGSGWEWVVGPGGILLGLSYEESGDPGFWVEWKGPNCRFSTKEEPLMLFVRLREIPNLPI